MHMEHFRDRPHDRKQNKTQQIQEMEIISSIFSDHKGLKRETNLKEKLKNTQIHGD